MDKKMTDTSRDIRTGRFLEENIPQLFNYMTDRYYSFAGIRLAMHYEALAEAYLEEGAAWSKDSAEFFIKINKLIKDTIINGSGSGPEKSVHTADKLRNGLMDRVKILTAYTDSFQIYEYILNRMEYRFKEAELPSSDDDFARKVLRYIFDSQDNLIINEKIKEIVGQLPIRMTKQRYFDLLSESIRHYTGADIKTLEAYLYILRSSAMLDQEKDMEVVYPKLWGHKTFLSDLNYKELTGQEYNTAREALDQAIAYINREVSAYYSLQEIINEVYALLLCRPYSGMSLSEQADIDNNVRSILQLLTQAVGDSSEKGSIKETTDLLIRLEGVQEDLADELSGLEDTLFTVDRNHKNIVESIMLEKLMNVLLRTRDLLSSSLFIDWRSSVSEKKADSGYVESAAQKLLNDLALLFASQDRAVTRAVMANTLNKMPVFFQDHKEVMDYVRSSLEHCSDSFEKAACMEIITSIMAQ